MDAIDSDTQLSHWRFAVRLKAGFPDAQAAGLLCDIRDLGVEGVESAAITRIYYVTGSLSEQERKRLGEELLADPVTEEWEAAPVDDRPGTLSPLWGQAPEGGEGGRSVEVAYHPGVRDPVEDSLKRGAEDLGIAGIKAVRTARAYAFSGPFTEEGLNRVREKLLINATVQLEVTPEKISKLLEPPQAAPLPIETVHLLQASDTVLQRVCLDHQLSLNLEEMRAIQAHYRKRNREPTLIELETLAQTWSEHCKHKTFRGQVVYTEEDEAGRARKQVIQDLLGETIVRATRQLNKPWCVSVFQDNSGVIAFDEKDHLCFKVETHNHPSALEPFGGASTGLGGVIRDVLGTGRSAWPVASTDVFCFAPPDLPADRVPAGTLAPKRIIKGVVAGVQDYGNKMGIPTVNGAVHFDERFVGNPLVYCGSVGLLPADRVEKQVRPGHRILLAGGRTGRDGIHGATFSSVSLETESEVLSSGAVQIGDPITEKRLADALMEARERDLFSSVTDCGAGGLSSAVGEMGAGCGARVELERVPLKYAGLNPAEIWISESQERMVLAVPPEKAQEAAAIFRRHGVEAADIGQFTDTGKLELRHEGRPVGELEMEFLHHGIPKISRAARWAPPKAAQADPPPPEDLAGALLALLSHWDTCSKGWIIHRYDHEVQGGSVLKPLVEGGSSTSSGRTEGPSDAAVIRPKLASRRGAVIANGINFRYGDLDPYWMAVLALDEVVRQVTAAGGDPDRLAVLDNFCFADPTRPEVLGALTRAALGCRDAALAYGTPFISGKDSLYNEYKVPARRQGGGAERTLQIPGTLLISGIGVVEDVARTLSMDAKKAGNFLYLAGGTRPELGGSTYFAHRGTPRAGQVPRPDLKRAPALLRAVAGAIREGLIVSAHDCSEGGLGVAAAEMAFTGGLGLTVDLREVPGADPGWREDFVLFSESPSRILLEVAPERAEAIERALAGFPLGRIGTFSEEPLFRVIGLDGTGVLEMPVEALRAAWERPFKGW